MRHLARGRKFGLKRGKRKAFLRLLANNLIRHERIVTTEARAKEIRMFVERLMRYGKKQNVAALRMLMQRVSKDAAYKVYHELAPKYKERHGGYTRITKLSKARTHDASKMARIEFI